MFNCLGKQKQKKNEDLNYTCDICGKKVATQHGLKIHKSIHYGPPMPPKSFVCPQCGLGFNTQRGLTGHQLVHNPGNIGSIRKFGGLGLGFDLNQPPPNS